MDLQLIIQDFLSRLNMPGQKAAKPFILGVIGNLGSGKSTVAKLLAKQLSGVVVVTADSARFLLKEAGLPWGESVRAVVRGVAQQLLQDGYAVILDGSNVETEEREQTAKLAQEQGVPVRYVRVVADYAVYEARLKAKYDDPAWQSSFERFRVGPTDKMLINLAERTKVHDALKDSDIVGLVGTIDNNGSVEKLKPKTADLAAAVLESIG